MATSILKKVNAEKAAKNVRTAASKINKEVMKTSDAMVDEAIVAGENWTKVMGKAMKAGTTLFGKQQDLMLDALEGIKGQSVKGTKRFGKLIGFSAIQKNVKEATKTAKAKVEATRQNIDEAYDKAMDKVVNIDIVKTVSETVDKATTTAKQKVEETRQAIDEVLENAVKVDTAKAKTKKSTKAVKKGIRKTVAKSTAKIAGDDLKKIEGIGPKMAMILNEAGIITFKQLAGTKVATVREILAAAGPRYNMHDPATWGRQAKLAAAGRFAELKTLQAELKGGKKVAKK